MSGEDKTEEEISSLYQEFNRICCEFDLLYRTIAMKMGMSDSAFQILMAIYDLGEGCTQSQVCAYSCLGKQTISSSVRKLQNNGLISLERVNGVRGLGLFLTAKGRKVVQERVAPVVKADVDALSAVGLEEGRRLVSISQEYLRGFEQNLSKVSAPQNHYSKDVE